MKAFILAAGLGTRLKPWTLTHPKALVPVGGVPMLERVICSLQEQGFDRIVVNVHHFSEQIIDFINARSWHSDIQISDESERLLDTGGALVHAAPLLCADNEPFLVHNVDILSNADLSALMHRHMDYDADATLLVSPRESSRRLLFDTGMRLRSWLNTSTGERRGEPGEWPLMRAFSGIHVISPSLVQAMISAEMPAVFGVMDYYLAHTATHRILGYNDTSLKLIDIGKPETLSQANSLFVS